MRQRKSAILISLLTGVTAACSQDAPQATGPSPAPESQAVAGAAAT